MIKYRQVVYLSIGGIRLENETKKIWFKGLRSSISSKVAVSAVLALVVSVGVSTGFSYYHQRSSEMSKLEAIHTSLRKTLEVKVEDINAISVKDKSSKLTETNASTDHSVVSIQTLLNEMRNAPYVGTTYLVYPENIQEKTEDGVDHLYTKMYAVADDLAGDGIVSHGKYDFPEYFNAGMEAVRGMQGEDAVAKTDIYNDGRGDWITYMSKVHDKDGNYVADFGIDFSLADINATLKSVLIKSIAIGLLISALFAVFIWLFVQRLLSPVKEIRKSFTQASEGDLTSELRVSRLDEFGRLSSDFNTMMLSLKSSFNDLSVSANKVKDSSSVLLESSTTSLIEVAEVAKNVKGIENNSKHQSESTIESKLAVEEMTEGVQRISESSALLADRIGSVAEETEVSRGMMLESVTKIETVSQAVQVLYSTLEDLRGKSSNIMSIVSAISAIAQQTNILSLNATIEAARAGEHGRGFAVVADEIRKLASQSGSSSSEISDILDEIVRDIQLVAVRIEEANKDVTDAVSSIQKAHVNVDKVNSDAKDISLEVQEVSAATEQLSAGAEEVLASVNDLSITARNTYDMATAISEAVQKQLQSAEEVKSHAEDLRQNSLDSTSEINKFKL
jgi:methyl-accepting chemotaxis protein